MPRRIRAGLTSASARTRRAALVALDQMTPPSLDAATVLPLLDSPDAATNKTAWWIAGHHRDWGAALSGYFDQRLAKADSKADRDDLVAKLAQFSRNPAIEQRLASSGGGRIA